MEYSKNFIDQITEEIIRIVSLNMANLPYHNSEHALNVYRATQMYAIKVNLSITERFLLGIAALFHDYIYVIDAKDNEENSAFQAGIFMKEKNFPKQHIEIVKSLILATKYPPHPESEMEKLMCDSDLDHLGTDECFKHSEKLKEEMKWTNNFEWLMFEKEFMKKHQYHSDIAKKLRNEKKAENLEFIESRIEELKGK